MPASVWATPEAVDSALSRLELTAAPLIDSVRAGYLERSSCTDNDAPNVGGFVHWARTLRTLRERLIPLGWSKCDDDRYCTVVNGEGRVAIAVASGNGDTGRPDGNPSTRYAKGPSTVAVVSANQLDLFPESLADQLFPRAEQRTTWILLFHVDANEIRSELSLPVEIAEDGYIAAWHERIILPAQPLDPSPVLPQPDFGPDLDISVTRRRSS